jgi:hypothetical protein
MNRPGDMLMDELPDLASDADVDALMTRLRARLEPPPQAAAANEAPRHDLARAFDHFVAAHEGLAASMARAMEIIVTTVEEFGLELPAAPAPARAPVRRRPAAVRRPARTAPSKRARR